MNDAKYSNLLDGVLGAEKYILIEHLDGRSNVSTLRCVRAIIGSGLTVLSCAVLLGKIRLTQTTVFALMVRFSSTVFVEGSPTLRLRTGCHEDSCCTAEVQSFVCR